MSLYYEVRDNQWVVLKGETFPIKDQIKSLGGRWNGKEKYWYISYEQKHIAALEIMGFQSLFVATPLTTETALLSESSSTGETNAPVGGASAQAYSVGQLLYLIDAILQKEFVGTFWVRGEISGIKETNGHLYFELVDEQGQNESIGRAASMSCALFADTRARLRSKLKDLPLSDGIQVKFAVKLRVLLTGGRISCAIEDVDPSHTLGQLALQRQEIVRKLRSQGLYDKNKISTKLSSFPLKIGLITARSSRACSDFLNEVSLSQCAFEISIFDCTMQGELTSAQVVYALNLVASHHRQQLDCVVITRGGGSRMDLRWFDDFEICKAIALCPLPVVCAVGHFEDISVADEVCFYSEKTPTGAARFLTHQVQNSFVSLTQRLERTERALLKRFQDENKKLNFARERLERSTSQRLLQEKHRLKAWQELLGVLQRSNDVALERGLSLLRDEAGHILDASAFFPGQHQPTQFWIQRRYQGQNIYVRVHLEEISSCPPFCEKEQ